jgi:hypothetical protein
MGWCGLDLSGPGQGPVAESCEHCNDLSGFMKGEGKWREIS